MRWATCGNQEARIGLTIEISILHALTPSQGSTCPYCFADRKDAASRKSFDTNRTLRRWANRGCYKQPVNKRPVYAACTRQCVSSAFGVFGSAEIKDLACYQYLGKFNSVPGHHVFNYLHPPRKLFLFHSVPKTSRTRRGLPLSISAVQSGWS